MKEESFLWQRVKSLLSKYQRGLSVCLSLDADLLKARGLQELKMENEVGKSVDNQMDKYM